MNNIEKILILDSNQRSALAATRSLGKAGLFIICADETNMTLAGSSRYTNKNITYPSPYFEQRKFIETLVVAIESLGIRYLLPMTDITAQLVLEMKSRFHNVIVLLPDYQSYMSVSDKYHLLEISLENDIPIPKTIFVESLEKLNLDINNLNYPVVVKPGRSIVLSDGKYTKTTVKYANTKAQLINVIDEYSCLEEARFLIQEYVEGYGEGLFVLCKEGEIIHYFSHKRLREKPPSGGVSVLSESIETREDILEIAKKILGPLKWNGVAMVEFKVTKDNQPYLMEVNGRFWGSLQLAIDSGVDFPFLLYKQFKTNEKLIPACEYKKGIQLRWLLGDVDNLIITLKSRELKWAKKLKSIFKFLKLYKRNQFYEVNRINDLKPAVYELLNYFKF